MTDRRIITFAAIATAITIPLVATGLVIADRIWTDWKNRRAGMTTS